MSESISWDDLEDDQATLTPIGKSPKQKAEPLEKFTFYLPESEATKFKASLDGRPVSRFIKKLIKENGILEQTQ